jgi:hypothetical protein
MVSNIFSNGLLLVASTTGGFRGPGERKRNFLGLPRPVEKISSQEGEHSDQRRNTHLSGVGSAFSVSDVRKLIRACGGSRIAAESGLTNFANP